MPVRPEAFFLPVEVGGSGQRFCLYHPGEGATTLGRVLYIHPFAEEMNKSRRMGALQARALAQAGFSVLQIDLSGCGDSSGNFGDATWQSWLDDVVQASLWLRGRATAQSAGLSKTPLWLWGLRAGCLVAVEAARHLNEPCNFLFWQPPSAGKPLLQQFLRLKVAGDMLGGQAKGAMETLRRQLAEGSPVEIAGYELSAGLAAGLEHAALMPPAMVPPVHKADVPRLEWFELSSREDASLSPASTHTLEQWRQAGFKVRSHIVHGPPFWQTLEIEEAPGLIAVTTAALAHMPAVPA